MNEAAPTIASQPGEPTSVGARLQRHTTSPALLSLVLAACTFAVYAPALRCQFLNFDDADYVSANPHVKAGISREGLVWAFVTGHAGNWHPLTWISHMLDAQFFGPSPSGPHLVNVLWHAVNTVLVFLVLRRLTEALWRSLLVAALFAWHPLHVESVAWVSERKDVLSACFFLLTLWSYGRYVAHSRVLRPKPKVGPTVHSPQSTLHGPEPGGSAEECGDQQATGNTRHAWRFYALAMVLFALGLMSKPMLVTLPFILLLLDFWPLQRLANDTNCPRVSQGLALCLEKIPFLLLSVVSALVTFFVQRKGGAVQSLLDTSLSERLANAAVSYARYLGKLVWPLNLALPYPHPGHWPILWVAGAVIMLALTTAAAFWLGRTFPFVPIGWLWFTGMLVPVIGLVQVGAQSMADRYAYLPSIGIFIMVVWGVGERLRRWRLPALGVGFGTGAVLLLCALGTRHQLSFWRDSETLFSHAVAVTTNNWLAYYNLAGQYDDRGRVEDALINYRRAAQIEPKCAEAWNNLGVLLVDKKQYAQAIECFQRALQVKPRSFDFHNNLGKALEESGRLPEAIAEFQQAVQLKPEYVSALDNLAAGMARNGQWPEVIQACQASLKIKPGQPGTEYNLANALSRVGNLDQAIEHYRLSLQGRPGNPEVCNDLGIALSRRGRPDEAIVEFREALRLEPTNASFACNLGKTLAVQNHLDEALPILERAERLAPTNADIQATLGSALANKGDIETAVVHLRKAMELRPDNPATHFNLGKALASQGKREEAAQQFSEALRLKPDFTPARQQLEALGGRVPR